MEIEGLERFAEGFIFESDEYDPYQVMERWLLDDVLSNKNELHFWACDKDYNDLIKFGDRKPTTKNNKVIEKALEFTADFEGEVYLDDFEISGFREDTAHGN